MTAAVGRVAKSAVGKAGGGGGSSFQGAASMGIERPPPGHFDTSAAPSTPAKKTAPKKAAPVDNTAGLSGEKVAPTPPPPPSDDGGGLKIGPPKMTAPQVPSVVNSGAGFVLGLLFWTWVALPFLNNGGVVGVKNQLRAKFLNKAPDGSWLP